jgi:glucose/arabinose dehydrogenase
MRCTPLLGLCALLGACGDDREPIPAPPPAALVLTPVTSGLSFPVFLTAPANDPRLFIVEKPGRIRIVENGTLVAAPFLDITSQVSSTGERGLLGLAFHPQYATNGFLYVNYSDLTGTTQVVRYTVSGNRNLANATAAKPIISIPQPYENHNGGMIAFGPDGMLYIGMGDGGSGGDPHNHSQNRLTLLGDMLRLDIDGGDPYRPAPGNPYIGRTDGLAEIWASGLRNPWRFSFDHEGGMLYVADVGQNALEEINVVPATQSAVNYGWRLMEGDQCFSPATCDRTGLTLPVLTYGRGEGRSVTGGYVYRGDAIPGLVGHYLYSDYLGGWLRSFRYVDGTVRDARDWNIPPSGNITSFGEDADRELYMMNATGTVYRIDKAP